MPGLEKVLMQHPLFQGLEAELGTIVAGCARNVHFAAGADLFREGEEANEFYLIRAGKVALEILAPGQPPVVLMTLGEGEIAGLSWLVPPYRWRFDAHAVEPVRALGIDARCLRAKCDADPKLGFELMKRVAAVSLARLHATRLQSLDVYRKPGT